MASQTHSSVLLLVEADLNEDEAIDLLEESIPDIQLWIQNFYRPESCTAKNLVHVGGGNAQRTSIHVAVSEVMAVEERVWSKKWGMKGAIDASIKAEIALFNSPETRQEIMPLELKTGKRGAAEVNHRGQVMLYILMMQERYGQEQGTDRK